MKIRSWDGGATFLAGVRRLLGIVFLLSASLCVQGALCTWTGSGSSDNWSDASNWDVAPTNGDSLLFMGTTRQTNVNDLLTSIGSIAITNGGFSLSGGALELNGTLSGIGDNTMAIPLSLSGSRMVENLSGILTLSGSISNNGYRLTLKPSYSGGVSGQIRVTGVISSGGVTVDAYDNDGEVVFTAANTYTGRTILSKGFLSVSNDSNLGTSPASARENLTLDGGLLKVASSFTLNANRSVKLTKDVLGGTGFYIMDGATLTYAGIISASSSSYALRLDGSGIAILTGASTYGGPSIVYCTVRISRATALGSSSSTEPIDIRNLGTLQLTGNITLSRTVKLDRSYLVNYSGNNTCSGIVKLMPNSGGKSTVSALSGTTLTLGSLYIETNDDAENPYENLYVEGAGNIRITGEIGDGGVEYALSDHGDVIMDGTGTLTLSGDSVYLGRTLVNSGTLQLGNGAASGSIQPGSAIINSGSLVLYPENDAGILVVLENLISGTGTVTKLGAAEVNLMATNACSALFVNGGVLRVNGSLKGAVTVNDTGTFGGTGLVYQAVQAKNGGTVQPGSSVGTVIITNDVTFDPGSTYQVELGEGTSCDKMNLAHAGHLSLGDGTATLDLIGTLTGVGCTIAYNALSVSGYFKDTAGNPLPYGTELPLQPGYYIYYVNGATNSYIVISQGTTAAEVLIKAYEAEAGTIVEFETIDEAGFNDILLYLYRDGQWVEVGRAPAAGSGSHVYRFVVPGLKAGDVADLVVRDDEGNLHTAYDLRVGSFAARLVQMAKGGMQLQWDSLPGRWYDVCRASKLSGPWSVVATVQATLPVTECFVPADATKAAGFYKILVKN